MNTNVSCIFHTVQLSNADPFPRYRANHRRLIRHVTLGHWSMTLMDIHGTNRHESRFAAIYSFTHLVGTTEALHEETCKCFFFFLTRKQTDCSSRPPQHDTLNINACITVVGGL